MNSGVVPADKNLRKKFIIFLGLTITAIFLFAPYFNDYIEQIKQISKENPEVAFKKTILIFKIALGIASLILLVTGVYLIGLARRILKSGQYPPPGMRVISNTRLRNGTQAKRAAISLIVLSCILSSLLSSFCISHGPSKRRLDRKNMGRRN